jgi:hypothetical protein
MPYAKNKDNLAKTDLKIKNQILLISGLFGSPCWT